MTSIRKFSECSEYYKYLDFIWEALGNLEPFVQIKKRGKDPWRSVLHVFLNCTNATKSRKESHLDLSS